MKASEKFTVGQRVAFTQQAQTLWPGKNGKPGRTSRGPVTVAGFSRDGTAVRVLFPGNKYADTFHMSFLEPERQEDV